MQVESCVWHCVFLTHTATARYFNTVWNHHITLVKGWFQSVSSKNEIMLRWRNVCAGVLITHQKIWTEQYPPISTVYPSAGVHPRASVLKDVLLCARWSAVWFGHVCVCVCRLYVFALAFVWRKKKKKKKIKVDGSCVRWRLYPSLLNPEVPLTQCFGRQIL